MQFNKTTSSISLLKQLKESKKLPIGHYGRKAALEAVEREYKASKELEARLFRSLRRTKKWSTWDEVSSLRFAKFLTDSYLLPEVRAIVFSCPEAREKECGGFYRRRVLHFPHSTCGLMVLIHELAHHIQHMEKMKSGHGEDFLWCEKQVWEVFLLYKKTIEKE